MTSAGRVSEKAPIEWARPSLVPESPLNSVGCQLVELHWMSVASSCVHLDGIDTAWGQVSRGSESLSFNVASCCFSVAQKGSMTFEGGGENTSMTLGGELRRERKKNFHDFQGGQKKRFFPIDFHNPCFKCQRRRRYNPCERKL